MKAFLLRQICKQQHVSATGESSSAIILRAILITVITESMGKKLSTEITLCVKEPFFECRYDAVQYLHICVVFKCVT